MSSVYNDVKSALRQAIEIEMKIKEKTTMQKKTLYRILCNVTINGRSRAAYLGGLRYGERPEDSTTVYPSFDALWDAVRSCDPKIPSYFFDTYINRRGRKLRFWADDFKSKTITSETLWQAEVRVEYIPVESSRFSIATLAEHLGFFEFIDFLQDSLRFDISSGSPVSITAATVSLYKNEGESRNVRQ